MRRRPTEKKLVTELGMCRNLPRAKQHHYPHPARFILSNVYETRANLTRDTLARQLPHLILTNDSSKTVLGRFVKDMHCMSFLIQRFVIIYQYIEVNCCLNYDLRVSLMYNASSNSNFCFKLKLNLYCSKDIIILLLLKLPVLLSVKLL